MEKLLTMTEVPYVAQIKEAQAFIKGNEKEYAPAGGVVLLGKLVAVNLEEDNAEDILRVVMEAEGVLLGTSFLVTGREVQRLLTPMNSLQEVLHFLEPLQGATQEGNVYFTYGPQAQVATFGNVLFVMKLVLEGLGDSDY